MKLFLPWDRRASVYDRASTVWGAALVLIALGTSFFLAGSIVGWFVGAAGLLIGALHPKCPRCGKSPFRKSLISNESPFYHFWQENLLWPEHICSQCRLNLTISHGEHTDE